MNSLKLIIHTDGGSRGNPGPAAYGVVFLLEGEVVKELSGYLGVATNNEAEYHGLLAAVKALPEFLTLWNEREEKVSLIDSVVIRMDSNLVVQQINRNWKIKEPRMKVLVEKIWEAMKPISGLVKIEYVPREQNSLADALVNTCLDAQ